MKNKIYLMTIFCLLTGYCSNMLKAQTGPGGVSSNLSLWLKADDGGASWTDGSPLGTTVTKTGTVVSNNNQANFNPALVFSNSSSYYDTNLSIARGTYSNVSIFTVANGRGENNRMIFGSSSANNHRSMGSNYFNCGSTNTTTAINGYGIYRASFVTGTSGASTLSYNGTQLLTTTDNNGSPINLKIGGGYYSSNSTDIAEMLVYRGSLTPAQTNQIESYLAIKYGATLPSDYKLSDGTAVWNTDATYQNNIAGIGRDFNSGLLQKQSQSVNSGFQPIIAKGSLAATNSSNSNGFAVDGDFLVWGSDTGSTTFSTPFVFNGLNYRMPRIWKMQKTGSVGIVKVAIPVSMWLGAVTQPTLLISGDATFDGSDSNFLMKKETIGGIDYYVTDPINLNITSGQYFSFAGFVTAPGGVLGEKLWLKADVGTDTTADGASLTVWNDQSGLNRNAGNANSVFFRAGNNNAYSANFNPTVDFTTTNSRIYNVTGGMVSTSTASIHLFLISNPRSGASTDKMLGAFTNLGSSGSNNWNELPSVRISGSYHAEAGSTGGTGSTISYNPAILGTTVLTSLSVSPSAGAVTLRQNGAQAGNLTGKSLQSGTQGYVLGNDVFGGGGNNISALFTAGEVIAYEGELTGATLSKVESYLALKYGVTKSGDYISSDAFAYWNSTSNSGYQNNIAGIGRDDASGLNQKQSQSVNSGIQPVIGNVNIADTNANNSNDFGADKTFMMWGSDTGSTNFATAFAFGGLNNRMARIWKVQETGTVGKVRVALKVSDLPGSVTKPTLLVSGDTTFDGSDDKFLMTEETIGGVKYYITDINADINLSSGQYFSFAAFVTAPGGVTASLAAWWKADYSASGTAWADASMNGRNASLAGGSITYKNGDFTTNFNPQLTTDGGWMSYTSPVYPNGSNYDNMNIFAIGQPVSGKFCVPWGETANNSSNVSTLYFHSNNNQYFAAPYGYQAASSNTSLYGVSNLIEGWKEGPNMRMYLQGKPTGTYNTGGGNYYSTGSSNFLLAYPGQASTGNSGLSEILAYNSPLSLDERKRVNSYLALKYGVTLDQSTSYNFNNGNFDSNLNYWTTSGNVGAYSGMAVFNGSNTTPNGVISQSISTKITTSYALTGKVIRIGSDPGTMRVRLDIIDNVTNATIATQVINAGNDINQPFTGNGHSFTIKFTDTSTATVSVDVALDNLSLTPNDPITGMDYVNSASNIIWDATANSTYSNNIAGIGRDDASALNQKQSQSVNGGIQPVIGNANIADTNANNGNDFTADKSFLVWGSDTGSTSFATPFLFGNSNFRMTRIWRVQETGTVGMVKVAIPVSQLSNLSQPSLLISADAIFTGSDTNLPMATEILGGVQYYTATVNFTSGQYFSFAGFLTAPGGVMSGLNLWVKGDAGVTNNQWKDQSSYGFVYQQNTAAYQPSNGLMNFNNSVRFDGSDDYFDLTSVTNLMNGSINSNYTQIAALNSNISTARGLSDIYSTCGGSGDLIWLSDSSLYVDLSPCGTSQPGFGGSAITPNVNYLNSVSYSSPSGKIFTYRNNEQTGSATQTGVVTTIGSGQLGYGAIGGFYNGQLGEYIIYNRVLSSIEKQIIDSYLGIRYGVTLSRNNNGNTSSGEEIIAGSNIFEGDYVASDNTTKFWNSDATYQNNIAGIGRDGASALLQKQSQSVNSGYQLIMGLSTVAATNAANTGMLNNLQFLMWGDNNESNAVDFTAIAGYNSRLKRVWKVQNTNAVNQDIQVLVPVTTSTVTGLVPASSSLLYSTDASFGTYQVRNPAGTVTINSKDYLAFNLPASLVNASGSNFYMTFAFYEQSPGGVRGEALWLRGDAGLTSTTKWEDQSPNDKDLRWDISDCAGISRGKMTLGNTLNFNTVARFGPSTTNLNEWTWGFSQTSIKRTDADSEGKADVAIIYKADEVKVQDVWGTDLGGIFDERSITTTQVANDNTGIGYSGGNSANATINVASFRSTEYQGSNMLINGNNVLNFTGNTRYTGCGTIRLGDVAGGGSGDFNPFKGLIGEFVVYRKNMSPIERIQLNSYLALKYGITLGRNNDGKLPVGDVVSASPVQIFEGDYLASDGITRTWNSDAVYQNNVVGLGRDDISAFHQRITTSQSATPDIITLSTDSNFVNTNQSGTNGHTDIANDKFFFVTGNNNGALTYTVKSGLSNDLNALMNRVWKVKKTGTAQGVYIKTSNTKATYLVYSTDATFSTGVQYVPLSGGVTTSAVNIQDGNYFTFATFLEAPGGVISTFWLRAGDNFIPGSWTDYNGNGYQFTQGDPTYRPTYTANSMNFNPTAYFNGNNFMSMTTFNGFLNNDMRNPHSFATALRTSTNNSTIINFEGTQTVTRQGDWDYLDNGGYSIDDQCRCSQPTYGGAALTDYNYSMIGTLTFSGGISATSGSIKYYRDGKRLSTASINPSSQAYGLTSNTRLGYRYGGVGGFLNGYLAEQVVFSKSLSDLEVTAVNSYMALKYGNTLSRDQDGDGTFGEQVSGSVMEGDYVASDHVTRVWINDLVYQNNIIGLAKDRTSTLHQRITKSQMPVSDIIMLSTDNNFTNANQSGASGHTDIANDMYFFITGHNGQPTTFTLKSGLNHSLNAIMNRVWKVQQTGTPQNVFVKVDNVRATYLIYSTDPTFSSNVTYKALASGVAAGVQIPTGNYFTFAAPLNGPGGVTDNLVRWYRADRDVVTGTTLTWKDQTVNADATQLVAGNQPVYNTSGASLLNFNPSFTFDAAQSNFMSFSDAGMANGSKVRSVFGVGRSSFTGNQFEWLTSYGTSAAGKNFGLLRSYDKVLVTTYNTGNDFVPYNSVSPYTGNASVISYGAASGSTIYGTYNALPIANMTPVDPINTVLNTGRIGTRQSGGENWNGVIGEVIYYNTIPSSTDKQRIDSYLGLKYGVTLGNNSSPFTYLSSDAVNNTSFWTGSNTYQNNIAGIGRDDISDLYQKQSQSVNSGKQVIIGLGSVAATNEANTGSFDTNLQFLVWGDNNTDMSGDTSTFTALYPYQERLNRVWRVQNTKSLSKDIQVLVPATYIKNLKVSSLLYSTDATFPAGSQVFDSNTAGVVTINSVDYKAFTIPAAQVNKAEFFFTMAYYQKSPGGVAGENLWLRADDEEIAANADNASVAAWKDQSGNNSHGTQAVPGQQPKYKNNATDNMNFNPVLAFNGGQNFDITGTLGIDGQKNVSVFAVSDILGAHYFLQPKVAGGNLLQFSSAGAGYVNLTLGGSSATNTTAAPSGGSAELYSGWRTTAGDVLYSGINAKQLNAVANTTNWTGGNLVMGNATNGKIPEMVEYSSSLNATQLQKVNSYLALKYGITINQSTTGQDYLASDGTKSWTADATYKYNIAGIGRDDLTALNQKQSQSVNTGDSQMLIALGSAQVSNKANINTFSSDMQYLVWGDDNGSLTTKVATGNVTANGLTYTKRFSRVWKTQNKGSFASDVKVYFPVSAFANVWSSSVGLIYASTAAKLSDGTASVVMNNGTETINGVSYYAFPVEASLVPSLNYLSFTTATSVCYKPAVTSGTALATKAGITALGRAGVNADNWPMVRKGGWMALEAKTKGMIINRVRFNASNQPVDDTETTPILTNAVEGMIVMDLTNRMLKVYTVKNGVAGWYEIGQQTCPD